MRYSGQGLESKGNSMDHILHTDMQTAQDAPLPNVTKKLAPWIKPRDEVTRIRNALHGQLASSTSQKSATSTNANTPSVGLTDERPIPASVTGIRRSYLRALHAHAVAQARYDALKADLEKVSQPPSTVQTLDRSDASRDSVVPLLQQREKVRRLQVIDRSLTEIENRGEHVVSAHLDDVIKKRAGEAPPPPSAQSSISGEMPDVDSLVLKLKKDVLATKRSIDACKDANRQRGADSASAVTGVATVAGLQAALNELTVWMEQQLSIIGDAETQSQEGSPTSKTNGYSTVEVASQDEVQQLYDKYVAARERLLQTLSSPPSLGREVDDAASTTEQKNDSHPPQRTTAAQTLLPYLNALIALKQEDQSLLQQSAYMRQSLAQSDGMSQRLIARLAEESHLVLPTAVSGQDWAIAAAKARQATAEYIEPKIRAGEKYTDAANVTLADIHNVPESVKKLSMYS